MEQNTFYYKLGDDNEWDVTANIDGRSVSIQPWLQTISIFAELALYMYVLKCEHTSSIPRLVILQTLYTEWGECDNAFAYALYEQGFNPKMLDDMVNKSWKKMIKLPLPNVFAYFHDDDVRLKIIDMCQRALSH